MTLLQNHWPKIPVRKGRSSFLPHILAFKKVQVNYYFSLVVISDAVTLILKKKHLSFAEKSVFIKTFYLVFCEKSL